MCEQKHCRACGKDKLVTDFHKKQEYPDGRYPRCKECVLSKTYIPTSTCITEDGTKMCSKCEIFKPIGDFAKRGNRKSGVASHCKKCKNSYPKNRNEGYSRNYDLIKSYGITVEDFEILLDSQGRCCKICGISQEEYSLISSKKKFLCVDHCHDTNIVRGILCDKCNRGLGLFQDNLDYLEAAVEYLKPYKSGEL